MSFTAVAWPCVVCQCVLKVLLPACTQGSCLTQQLCRYMGQSAFLIKHPETFDSAFWSSVPELVFAPLLIVGTLAAIVASQVSARTCPMIIRAGLWRVQFRYHCCNSLALTCCNNAGTHHRC